MEKTVQNRTREMVYMAMFIAIVFVATNIRVHIPLGTGGLIHIGTLVMFAIALKYGPRYGAVSAAIGMTIFDFVSGWASWAPGTFLVRLIAGFVVGYLAYSQAGQGENAKRNVIAIAAGGLVIVVGYYFFEALFITEFYGAFASIPGNLAQIAIGVFSLFILKSLPPLPSEIE